MATVRIFALLMLQFAGLHVWAQAAPSPAPTIDAYIHRGWDSLSRSMSECQSLIDPKVTTPPLLYLPYGAPMPPELTRLSSQCKIDVEHLPRPIVHLGDVKQSELKPGLLYLPKRYVVPGGRFNEMFGWDSYFIILGLLRDGRVDLARGMVENFFYEIENYGAILNANRTYFLTRSQPPFLSSMIRAVYDAELARDSSAANLARQKEWLTRAYLYAHRDHDFWLEGIHQAGKTGLARYLDIGEGPVPDIADHSSYYIDVIEWLVAHPDVHTNYLLAAPEHPSPAQQAVLAKTSCDDSHSVVCGLAWSHGYRLTRDFYKGDRSDRESGFDITFRFEPFSGSTHHFAPVCLNSLLYKYERDLADLATMLKQPDAAAKWKRAAEARRAAINKYLWDQERGMFFDYDFIAGKRSTYVYATIFYPLWAGLATKEQAAAVDSHLAVLDRPGGLASSNYSSGLQWDLPFGWAPLNWLAVEGLRRAGYPDDARRVAEQFTRTVRTSFEKEGSIHEKYNVETESSKVDVIAGYQNVIGFGWTNAVYIEMEHLLHGH
jgi:alpha,alpha-trehalase